MTLSHAPIETREADLLRAAFREVHGAALHGFALLLTVGDRSRAGAIAGGAMSAGSARASELRHPERAAAWLRRRALLAARRPSESRPGTRPERSAVLMELGVQGPALAALEGLSLEDRAAIVAASIERLAMADVATILDRDLERTRRTVRAARRRYTSAAVHWLASEPGATPLRGEISDRVEQAATRAIGPGVIGPRATGSLR